MTDIADGSREKRELWDQLLLHTETFLGSSTRWTWLRYLFLDLLHTLLLTRDLHGCPSYNRWKIDPDYFNRCYQGQYYSRPESQLWYHRQRQWERSIRMIRFFVEIHLKANLFQTAITDLAAAQSGRRSFYSKCYCTRIETSFLQLWLTFSVVVCNPPIVFRNIFTDTLGMQRASQRHRSQLCCFPPRLS